jgi:hypothetical protein
VRSGGDGAAQVRARLRARAAYYRELAEAQPTGGDKQQSYLEIAELLEHEADAIRDDYAKRTSKT